MRITAILKHLVSIDWLDTVAFNLAYLPWCQARHLPILLYHAKNRYRQGKVILNVCREELKFGMIKLGVRHESTCNESYGIVIDNNGLMIFNGSMIIGNGTAISIKRGATLSFGRNIGITGDVKIHCHEKVEICDLVSCAWGVTISDTDFHTLIDADNNQEQPRTKPVYIGKRSWLCQNVLVSKGTYIPEDVTIGACSMVNRDYRGIQKFSVIAGPGGGKILNKRVVRKDIQRIKDLQNWNITEGLEVFNSII